MEQKQKGGKTMNEIGEIEISARGTLVGGNNEAVIAAKQVIPNVFV